MASWYQYSVDRFTKLNTGSGSSGGKVEHIFEVITEIEPKSNTTANVRFKLRNINSTLGGSVYVHLNSSRNGIYFVSLKPSNYAWPGEDEILDLGSDTVTFTITKKATDKYFQMFPCQVYLAPESHSPAASLQATNWENIRQLHAASPNAYNRGKWTLFAVPPGNCDLVLDTIDNAAGGWLDIPDMDSVIYSDTTKTNNSQSHNKVKVTVQYNPHAADPESVSVRFKLEKVNSNDATNYYDGMYILFNGNGKGGDKVPKLLTLKGYAQSNDAWVFYSDPITITKTYNAATFRLQEFHICNHQSKTHSESAISVENFITLYYGTEATRKKYRKAVDAQDFAIAIPNTVATAINCNIPYIVDNKNNTFSIVVKNLYEGTLNPINNIQLTCKRVTDSTAGHIMGVAKNKSTQTFGPYEIEIDTKNQNSLNYMTNAKQRVYSTLTVEGKYNDLVFQIEADVNCYVAPILKSVPLLCDDCPEEVCQKPGVDRHYSWCGEMDLNVLVTNTLSPLKGYLLRLDKVDATGNILEMLPLNYVNNKICYGTSDYLTFESTKQETASPKIYEIDLIRPFVTINVSSFISAGVVESGDILRLGVAPYSQPSGSTLGTLTGIITKGETFEVQVPEVEPETKGTLKVFTSERSWETGQVYVKIDSTTWVAAEAVYVYTDKGWQISE